MKNILYILYLIYREQIVCSKMHKNTQLYKRTFARLMNCVEIDREERDLYLLRRYVNGFRPRRAQNLKSRP